MTLFAHTFEGKPVEDWQRLDEHLENVGSLAESLAGAFGASEWGRTAGLLHDAGKAKPEFQKKLHTGSRDKVDHKSVGAKLAADKLGPYGTLLGYCIAGHHGGLPNGGYARAVDGSKSLEMLYEDAAEPTADMTERAAGVAPLAPPFPAMTPFQGAFFTRMLFSALVDADFLDTERFMTPEKSAARIQGPPLAALVEPLNRKLSQFSRGGRINSLRDEILKRCRSNASLEPGLFTLTVPTGGGKTLASMAFALDHAVRHGLRRVVYVIPYTSIIEQNAAVFADMFPAHSVVEHHSNFDADTFAKQDDGQSGQALRHRLACENWDAPVIVTTNVQFFESLHGAKPSRCRKLHNLAGAVIILDEAQMLPVKYLKPCLRALEELARNYGASVVLCTATQPALNKREEFPHGLEGLREIAPDPGRMHREFKRTRLADAGTQSLDAVAEMIRAREQVLCIVNTRDRASRLFALVADSAGAHHLSALMCPAHRSAALADIRTALGAGEPCRVVSTQLVEAGVDISFPEVLREMSGLDSITQAAGRCNREGDLDGLGTVTVFTPEEGVVPAFRMAAGNTQSTLRRHGDDPFSPAAITEYFAETYWLRESQLDEKGILEHFADKRANWAFRDAACAFRLIENDMMPIIIPWNDTAHDLVKALRHAEHAGGILRRLQQYTVQVYRHQFAALDRAGAVELINGVYAVLADMDYYTTQYGLTFPERDFDAGAYIF
jgi:CRISPR-associated endonuclease/helicase Cas3